MFKPHKIKHMKYLSTLFFGGFAVMAISLTSCGEDDGGGTTPPPPPADNSILGVAADQGYTDFVAAIDACGLTPTLSGDGPFTVFVPANAAVSAAIGLFGATDPTEVGADTLSSVLLTHVVAGEVYAGDLATGYVKSSRPVSTDFTSNSFVDIFVNTAGPSVAQAGEVILPDASGGFSRIPFAAANIVVTDIQCDNGVIHIVDNVVVPGGLGQMLTANPDFSTLVAALEFGSESSLNTYGDLVAVLSNPDMAFTLFAPNNAAFEASLDQDQDGDVDGDDLNALGADAVFGVLADHFVIGQMVLSSELTDGQSVTTASQNGQLFDATALTIGGAPLNAGGLDICGSNGAIHIIDRVIGF
tara:strand:+ start:969 stop:2042 length:1074 start_codon:yes stop_codon:yes gene_type:complete